MQNTHKLCQQGLTFLAWHIGLCISYIKSCLWSQLSSDWMQDASRCWQSLTSRRINVFEAKKMCIWTEITFFVFNKLQCTIINKSFIHMSNCSRCKWSLPDINTLTDLLFTLIMYFVQSCALTGFACVCFLQLPATGQLSAVWDGALQEGSVPAVLSALAHRQPERVGWRGGGQMRHRRLHESVLWNQFIHFAGITTLFPASPQLVSFSPAAVWYGQRDFPHGGAGGCRRGGRWVTVFIALMVSCEGKTAAF